MFLSANDYLYNQLPNTVRIPQYKHSSNEQSLLQSFK